MATPDFCTKDDPFFQNALRRIRSLLNDDKVKLWEPPFTKPGESDPEIPEDLICSYAEKLGIEQRIVGIALAELRAHAVEKLAARKKFSETGIGSLSVKLSRQSTGDGPNELKIETTLDIHGAHLKEIIKQKLDDRSINEVKLIFSGRVIDDDMPLASQGVKNNSTIMAICLSNIDVQAREGDNTTDALSKKISNKRKLAQTLAKRKGASEGKHERYYLEIKDQSGKEIDIPMNERESLSLAMTFHEMGRDLMTKEQYNEAVLLLLESDAEFKKCQARILDVIDNFGLLCLDVVWCYFKIKSLDNLPDAEERLRNCKVSLNRSYGANMERASLLEGRTGNEMMSYVRLHLLESVCNYHGGQYGLSSKCLMKAEEGVRELMIDDTKLSQVMSMGFTAVEGKRALRACKGDVTESVDFITKRKTAQTQLREKEQDDRRKWKLARKLGKTSDGKWVDVDAYNTLQSMGFSDTSACNALRHSNNRIDQALEILQTNPELLNLPNKRRRAKHSHASIPDDLIQQVVAMGFDFEVAKKALARHDGDVQNSIDELLLYGGSLPEDFLVPVREGPSQNDDDGNNDYYDDDYDDDDSQSSGHDEDTAIDKEVSKVMKDIGKGNDDQSDLNLEDEIQLIEEYRTLLSATRQ